MDEHGKDLKSRVYAGLLLQDVRVGLMQIAIIFESSDADIKLVTGTTRSDKILDGVF